MKKIVSTLALSIISIISSDANAGDIEIVSSLEPVYSKAIQLSKSGVVAVGFDWDDTISDKNGIVKEFKCRDEKLPQYLIDLSKNPNILLFSETARVHGWNPLTGFLSLKKQTDVEDSKGCIIEALDASLKDMRRENITFGLGATFDTSVMSRNTTYKSLERDAHETMYVKQLTDKNAMVVTSNIVFSGDSTATSMKGQALLSLYKDGIFAKKPCHFVFVDDDRGNLEAIRNSFKSLVDTKEVTVHLYHYQRI